MHYLAYKIYGIPAHFRKSLLAPGISPNETIVVTKMQGIVIGLSGYVFSTIIFVLPNVFAYPLWKALFVGSIAGSIVDFIWVFSMILSKYKIEFSNDYLCPWQLMKYAMGFVVGR